MNIKLQQSILALMFFQLIAFSAFCGDLPHTQVLIRREIISLGGEWEGTESLSRICYSGDRFREEHFEMLTHCRELPWLGFSQVTNCTPDAMKPLQDLKLLRRLDIFESDCLLDGLVWLKASESIEEVRVDGIRIKASVLGALQKVRSLKKLVLNVETIDEECLVVLGKCTQLKRLELKTAETIDNSLKNRLLESIPNCKVSWQ